MRSLVTMRFGQFLLVSSIALTMTIPSVAATRTHRSPTASHHSTKHASKSRIVGQRSIDDERATQIQEALVKAGYLTGQPSGHWDAESIAAMGKLQADNGWQTKLVPDSRALIKLGLGPTTATPVTPAVPSASTFAPNNSLAQR